MKKLFLVASGVLVAFFIAGIIGGYLYWRHLETTPQYSLALLIDAARKGDNAAFNNLVDIDAVVEDFVPQIIDKAAEIYGRGQSPLVIQRMRSIASPLLPAVKQHARNQLPGFIHRETSQMSEIPFFAMVLWADEYLDITVDGDKAIIRTRSPNHELELTMRRNGSKWQVVGIRDGELASRIAQAIGEQVIGFAAEGDIKSAGAKLGVKNIEELIRKAEEIVK